MTANSRNRRSRRTKRKGFVCGHKRRYWKELDVAKEAAKRSTGTVQLRWYRCMYCKAFHLTSKV